MKLFVVLRYGALMDTRIEKEEIVEADYFTVSQEGSLTFYRYRQTGPDEIITIYAPSAWLKITERPREAGDT